MPNNIQEMIQNHFNSLGINPKLDETLLKELSPLEQAEIVGRYDLNKKDEYSEEYNHKKDYKDRFGKNWAHIEERARQWGKDPDAIASIIIRESGGDTKASNSYTNATGLFQFMPATAKSLGVTTDQIKKMSFEEQLDLGGKYFESFGSKWNDAQTANDMYSLVFYPKMLNESDDYVLGSHRGDALSKKIAKQNKIYDLDSDGYVTKREVYEYGDSHFKNGGILKYKK